MYNQKYQLRSQDVNRIDLVLDSIAKIHNDNKVDKNKQVMH